MHIRTQFNKPEKINKKKKLNSNKLDLNSYEA